MSELEIANKLLQDKNRRLDRKLKGVGVGDVKGVGVADALKAPCSGANAPHQVLREPVSANQLLRDPVTNGLDPSNEVHGAIHPSVSKNDVSTSLSTALSTALTNHSTCTIEGGGEGGGVGEVGGERGGGERSGNVVHVGNVVHCGGEAGDGNGADALGVASLNGADDVAVASRPDSWDMMTPVTLLASIEAPESALVQDGIDSVGMGDSVIADGMSIGAGSFSNCDTHQNWPDSGQDCASMASDDCGYSMDSAGRTAESKSPEASAAHLRWDQSSQRDTSSHRDESSQRHESSRQDESSQRDESLQRDESSQRDSWSQRDQSSRRDESCDAVPCHSAQMDATKTKYAAILASKDQEVCVCVVCV